MSVRSLNGLGSSVNVYLNRDPIQATEPVLATQPTTSDPITISLKGLTGYGGAGKVVRVNTNNNGLEYADDIGSNWTLGGFNIYPTTATKVLVNTTTNSDNRTLLINGDAEIATQLYLTGSSSTIQIDNSSSSGLYFKNATSQGFKFFADNGNSGSPHLDNETISGYLFKISSTATIKHRFLNGIQEIYSDGASTDTTKTYFVKASNTNIGNYIQNDFTNNTFQLRTFTSLADNYFLQYDTTNEEMTIPYKLKLTAATNQLSNGTYNYILPSGNGTLALTTDPANTTTSTNFGTAASSDVSIGNSSGDSLSIGLNLYGDEFKLYNTSNVSVATFTPLSNSCNLTLNGGELQGSVIGTGTQFLSNVPVGIAYGGTGLSGFGITDALKYLQVNSGGTGFQLATITAIAEWTLNSTNLYPNSTSTNVVIGTTTNSGNKTLFVNGASEINSDLDVNGTTTSTHFLGNSGSSFLKGIITNPSSGSYPYIAYGSIEQAYIKNATIANQIIIENHTGTYRNIYITCDPNDDRLQVKGDLETGYGASNTPYVGLGNSGSYGTIYNPSGTNGGNSIAGSHINYHENGTFMGFNLPNTTYASGSGQNFNWYSGNSKRMQLNGSTSPSLQLLLTTGTSSYCNIGQGSSFPPNFSYWSNLTIPIGTAMYMGGNQTNDAEGYLLAMNGNTMMISNPGDDYSLKYYDEDGGGLGWTISASGSLASGSDSRIKRDITTYKNSNFEKFKQIRTITYKQKIPDNIRPFRLEKQSCIDKYNNINYGIVAQEIFKIYPELEDSDDIRKREKFYYRKNNWANGVYEKEHKEWVDEKEEFEKEKKEEYKTPEPQLEFNEEEPMRAFTYKNLSILTIGVVQDLIKENETLKEEVNGLKEIMNKLINAKSFVEFKKNIA